MGRALWIVAVVVALWACVRRERQRRAWQQPDLCDRWRRAWAISNEEIRGDAK